MLHIWMSHRHTSNMCGTTHPYVWHDSFIWVMPHIWMSHVTHMNESCHTSEWVMSHILHLCVARPVFVLHTTLIICVSCNIRHRHISCICGTPHLYLWHDFYVTRHFHPIASRVRSNKLYLSSAKEPYKRDYILQKRPIVLLILFTVATEQTFGKFLHFFACICASLSPRVKLFSNITERFILILAEYLHSWYQWEKNLQFSHFRQGKPDFYLCDA